MRLFLKLFTYMLFQLVSLGIPIIGAAQTRIITTVAGNGFTVGDGGAATLATLCSPLGIATDRSGNVYIADICDNMVRKVNTSGIISTVAGNGTAGYSGDGGMADTAELNSPYGIAVDDTDNLYIADENNSVIRKVSHTGIITTIAGNGTTGYSGDGGPATAAALHKPTGVAIDDLGNIYIADVMNNVIREVRSGIITTYAGNGHPGYTGDGGPADSAELYIPLAVATDRHNNVYIADYWNNVIRKVSGGIISTVAGNGLARTGGDGGPATAASIYNPTGLALDYDGDLYVTDNQTNTIRVVNGFTQIISTVAGDSLTGFSGDGGPAVNAQLNNPYGLATDRSGNFYIADAGNDRVRVVNTSGIIHTFSGLGTGGAYYGFGSFGGDGGPADSAYLNRPSAVIVDSSRDLYIADQSNNRVRIVKAPANIIHTYAGNGIVGYKGDGGLADTAELNLPCGLALNGNLLYIADMGNNAIRMVNSGIISTIAGTGVGGYNGDGIIADTALLNSPTDVVTDAFGNILIADRNNNRVRKINTSGIITTVAGNGTGGYSGDFGPATAASLYFPSGLAIDASGNVYIADMVNNCVRKVNTAGIITTFAGTGTAGYSGDSGPADSAMLWSPTGVAVDAVGNVYISDRSNFRIRMVDAGGIIHSIGGTGVSGFSGDGGPSDSAQLDYPYGIGLDDSAYIYIADTKNQRIRRISPGDSVLGVRPAFANSGKMMIYPNPNNGEFSIMVASPANETIALNIISAAGASVYSGQTVTNKLTTIQLNVPDGIYFINAFSPDLKYNAKLTVIH